MAAIAGVVPAKMVRCLAVFLDFCYLARHSEHDTVTLEVMEDALAYFHELRTVFVETGVRPDGFGLPRQHALVHYVPSIRLFGSPNGICTSITESKHIDAVKRPWRASSKNKPLGQIIRTNTRLLKLSAARIEFSRRGMLQGDVYTAALREVGIEVEDRQLLKEQRFIALQEAQDADGHAADGSVSLSERPGMSYVLCCMPSLMSILDSRLSIEVLSEKLEQPGLLELIQHFLYMSIYPDDPDDIFIDDLPELPLRLKMGLHLSASATFLAPSELCGPGGMHREMIRCNPTWFKEIPRYDTVLVRVDDTPGMRGLSVVRVRAFLSFVFEHVKYQVALVEWFTTDADQPDPLTGMWVVRPAYVGDIRSATIIPISSIVRACHLMPVFGNTPLPLDFSFIDTLDAFKAYYINHYIDYHAHETLL